MKKNRKEVVPNTGSGNFDLNFFGKNDCNCYCCKDSKYEPVNIISENGDSIFSPPIGELPGGQVYVNESKIRDIVKEELDKRFGPSINKNYEDE